MRMLSSEYPTAFRPAAQPGDRVSVKISGMEEAAITEALVSRLVATQFPRWAHLPVVPAELDGNDNTKFRLGEELSVRLPRADAYVPQVEQP